jgi:hypothetical protein
MGGAAAGAVTAALAAGLRSQAARFAADGLPLTGVVGAPHLRWLLDPVAALTARCDGGAAGDAEGAGGVMWCVRVVCALFLRAVQR